jgi:aryl-alcohol dehydrogenase-like predicted oxidoreductase
MTTNPLGHSGLNVSALGFGAWPISGTTYGDTPRTDGLKALERYLELGGRFIDTARAYRTSENIIGEVLHKSNLRSEIVIASKTKANNPHAMIKDLETSLGELRTDYLDIYYLHQPPADIAERDIALEMMHKFKEEGKIRVIGASINGPDVNTDTEQMCRDYIATGEINVIQMIFSIFRQGLRPILQLAQANGVGIVGRTTLESGFLTGKYSPGTTFPEGDHRNRWTLEHRDRIFEAVKQVRSLIGENPTSNNMVSAAIRFAIDEPGIDTVILGAKNARQCDQTFRLDQIPHLSESVRQNLIETFVGQDSLCNLA